MENTENLSGKNQNNYWWKVLYKYNVLIIPSPPAYFCNEDCLSGKKKNQIPSLINQTS